MKDKILHTARDLAVAYGVKSITMDDIANKVGCSKKTLYKFFANKEELLFEVAKHFQSFLHNHIREILQEDLNAIEENFKIRKIFKDLVHISDSSPIFQMRKYYPKVYEFIMNNEKETSLGFIEQNIKSGIVQGLYREDTNIENAKQFYFVLMTSIHESEAPIAIQEMEIDILGYHTRAIATPKGVIEFEKQLKQFYTNQNLWKSSLSGRCA